MPAESALVDDDQVEAFARDGVLCARSLLAPVWLERLASGIERNEADRGPHGCDYTAAGHEGRFWDDYCNWQRFDDYRAVLTGSPLAALAGRVMGSTEVRIFHEHVLVKEAGTAERTPWHHDQPYYCVDGDHLVSTWVPLDPVSPAAAIRFVAGSHLGPMYRPRRFVDHGSYPFEEFDPVPEIADDDPRILSWSMEPGDVLVFHGRTLHASGGSDRLRRAFSARWLGDDARYARRSGPTSPPFPELADDLVPGDPMHHHLFPVVWRDDRV